MSANAPYALPHRLPHTGVNTFMLITTAMFALANVLASNILQNMPFWRPKQAVSASETGHIAAQNRPFRNAGLAQAENWMQVDVF